MSFLSATWLWANGLRWSWLLKLCNTISYIFMFHLFSNHSCREIVASPDFCRFNDSKSFLLFLEKYPGMDMISFGPTLRGVHSPDEKVDIETVGKWWKHLVDILERLTKEA